MNTSVYTSSFYLVKTYKVLYYVIFINVISFATNLYDTCCLSLYTHVPFFNYRSRNHAPGNQTTDKASCSEERWLKPSTSVVSFVDQQIKVPEKADLLLSAILRTNAHSDQKFPLKRKLEIDDEVCKVESVQQNNLKNGCELSHINSKINVQNLSLENQKHGCNKNKQCTYSSTKINELCSVTKLTDGFRTIDDESKSCNEMLCSFANRFRTKQCDKKHVKEEQNSSAKYDKFDVDLLHKINTLDINKNNEVGGLCILFSIL